MQYYSEMSSPLGKLLLTGDGEAITGLFMEKQKHHPVLSLDCVRDDSMFAKAQEQIEAWFAGERKIFDLPLAGQGTTFQKKVWQALCDIPYGETLSYGQLASRIGKPAASRAVGLANGRNPIGLIVPCHRVIGADGTLTGYGGGIERKRWLLAFEQQQA